jgi:hypothetical protein
VKLPFKILFWGVGREGAWECSGLEYYIEENLKWRLFDTEIIELGSLNLNIEWRENIN